LQRLKGSAGLQPSKQIIRESNMQREFVVGLLVAVVSLCRFTASFAAESWPVETLAKDLVEPSGLAIQPTTESVFICESGTGKILAFPKDKADSRYTALQGFPSAEKAKDGELAQRGGLAGLGFLDEQNLAVAYSKANRKPAISVFELPAADSEKKPVAADAAKQTLGPADFEASEKNSDKEATTLGSFFGVTVSPFNPPALFVTNPGNPRGWLFKADVRNHSGLEALKPFMTTKATPLAITMNRRGVLVVSANSGTGKDAPESTLSFYNWRTGALIASFPAPLADIVGLAYSPESGRLYAASFSRAKPNDAGIYRLDAATVDNRAGMKSVKVLAVERPTALAFTVGNTLYATALGKADGEGKGAVNDKGTLLKITGDL
jgi:hypothetical protein